MSSPEQPVWMTAEQAQQMVTEALAQHQEAAAAGAGGTISADQVQAIVDQALARQAESHNTQLQGLMASLRGSVATFVPFHSGGNGTEIADTWSQYEQTRARAADEAALAAAVR